MSIEMQYQTDPIDAYGEVRGQIFDNASFLWILRSIAVEQPHYSMSDILQLEQRIEAQLNGLMTSIEQSWSCCLEGLLQNEPGEVFTTAVLAFRSHDIKKIQVAVEAAMVNEETEKGFISALGWLPAQLVQGWIDKLLGSKDLNHKYLAIAGCSVRRENPGEALNRILQREDCQQHDRLYNRALRLIGEIRRQDLMPVLEQSIHSEKEDACFWANWSACLLGSRVAVDNLLPYVLKAGKHQNNAINIVFRVLPVEQARQCIAQLSNDKLEQRAVIKATGVLADPNAVNWLISQMANPALARLAAEAFTQITGFDLELNHLNAEAPKSMVQLPNDDEGDEDVSLDEDENLSWPDIEKVKTFWINHGRKFMSGRRYFMGDNIAPEKLLDKLNNAKQRQRHAAALELALIDSNLSLQNTRARASI